MEAFKKGFAKDLMIILKFVDDVAESIGEDDDRIHWQNQPLNEVDGNYAFTLWNESKTLGIFFGIWMSYWEGKEYPICICLESQKDIKDANSNKFQKFLSTHSDLFHSSSVYEKYTVAAVKQEIILGNKEKEIASAVKELFFILNLHQPISIARPV